MKKEKFSIELYESTKKSGCKIKTVSGNPVEILKTDCKSDYPVIGVIKGNDGKELVDLFSPVGTSFTDSHNNLEIYTEVVTITDGDYITFTFCDRKMIGIVKSKDDKFFKFYCYSNVDMFFNPGFVEFNRDYSIITISTSSVKDIKVVTDEDIIDKLLTAIENQGITIEIGVVGGLCFDPPKFNVGDKVFGFDGFGSWRFDFYSHKDLRGYVCTGRTYSKIVPFNDYTRNLLGRR